MSGGVSKTKQQHKAGKSTNVTKKVKLGCPFPLWSGPWRKRGERRSRGGGGEIGVSHFVDASLFCVMSSPLPSGMAVVIMSPVAVVPLQRGEGAGGLSQLDQSMSSKSAVSGVQEKCLVRFELVRLGRPMLAVSDSFRGSKNRGVGVGVCSLVLVLKALATCGRDEVTEARIVSLSLSSL